MLLLFVQWKFEKCIISAQLKKNYDNIIMDCCTVINYTNFLFHETHYTNMYSGLDSCHYSCG